MLVLTRKLGEAVVMTDPDGRRIVIRVNRVRGDQVRIAIDAPRDVNIAREELDWIDPPEKGSR